MAVEWESAAAQLAGTIGGCYVLGKVLVKAYLDKDKAHLEDIRSHIDSQKEQNKACDARYDVLLQEVFRMKDDRTA